MTPLKEINNISQKYSQRQAIIRRVAAKVYKGCYPEFDRQELDNHIEDVLEKAGFFELLEAAEEAMDCSYWYCEQGCKDELDAVLRKIRGK